jgi:hypothetical protein
MMADDAYHAEVIITRKPWPERKVLFTCVICDNEVEENRFRWKPHQEHEPVCNDCTRRYGSGQSGPVFNRLNTHRLRQLSAVINCLKWEIKNGRYNRHR